MIIFIIDLHFWFKSSHIENTQIAIFLGQGQVNSSAISYWINWNTSSCLWYSNFYFLFFDNKASLGVIHTVPLKELSGLQQGCDVTNFEVTDLSTAKACWRVAAQASKHWPIRADWVFLGGRHHDTHRHVCAYYRWINPLINMYTSHQVCVWKHHGAILKTVFLQILSLCFILFISELFEINHIRTIYHMFIAVLLIFCMSTLAVDYIDQGRSVCCVFVGVHV